MIELATLQAVSYIMGSLGVFVAAVYYVLNIQNNRRNQEMAIRNQELSLKAQEQALETRQTQIFMDLYKTIASKEFMMDLEHILFNLDFKDREDYYRKYGSDVDPIEHSKVDFMLSYYQGIGLLVKRRLIDPELVYKLMRYGIIAFWEKIKPVVEGDRLMLKIPNMFEDVEYLYDLMKSYREKENLKPRA
jgi:hypothetical protein